MTSKYPVRSENKSTLSASQKTFNRLKKKVETLQKKLKEQQHTLDEALKFFHSEIVPKRKGCHKAREDFIKLAYKQFKEAKGFTKQERFLLKKLIQHNLKLVLNEHSPNELDPEISALFEELYHVSYAKIASDKLNELKEDLQDHFEEEGIDIDLSHIHATDDEAEVRRKLFEAMQAARAAMENEDIENEVPKPKSKKQLQKEMKEQELAALQKKGLGSIYKKLAKEFHPDLEQDLAQKAEKEKMMKRLTTAYRNNDLHTLLTLEMEWASWFNNQDISQSDEHLQLFNEMLKDQIKALENDLEEAALHPQFFAIRPYYFNFGKNMFTALKMEKNELQSEIAEMKETNNLLTGARAKEIIRDILEAFLD